MGLRDEIAARPKTSRAATGLTAEQQEFRRGQLVRRTNDARNLAQAVLRARHEAEYAEIFEQAKAEERLRLGPVIGDDDYTGDGSEVTALAGTSAPRAKAAPAPLAPPALPDEEDVTQGALV